MGDGFFDAIFLLIFRGEISDARAIRGNARRADTRDAKGGSRAEEFLAILAVSDGRLGRGLFAGLLLRGERRHKDERKEYGLGERFHGNLLQWERELRCCGTRGSIFASGGRRKDGPRERTDSRRGRNVRRRRLTDVKWGGLFGDNAA